MRSCYKLSVYVLALSLSFSLTFAHTTFASSNALQSQLEASITFVNQSLSSCEVTDSPSSPTQVFLRLLSQYSPDHACEALQSLTPASQLYFRDALQQIKLKYDLIDPKFKCLLTLEARVEAAIQIKLSTLDFVTKLKTRSPLSSSKNRAGSKNDSTQKIIGPSEELIIDTSGGPRFVYADLPNKHIAFTFDDGPHHSYTTELLEVLRQHKIQATFFTVGKNVEHHPDIVKNILADGHTLANHSQSHSNMRKISNRHGEMEINNGFKALLSAANQVSPFFRFPYGNHTPHLRKYLQHENIGEFFWSIDTLDWKIKDPLELYNYALNQIENAQRGIILFHDVQYQTVKMMPHLLKTLAHKGYKVVFLTPKNYL